VVDTDALSLLRAGDNKAIRYGVTVGEDALSWYGIAKVGRKEEWPTWTPTADIKKRMDVPNFVEGSPQTDGRPRHHLFTGNKTRCSIHGTNQPEYIAAISSGCIRDNGRHRSLQPREDGLDRGAARARATRCPVRRWLGVRSAAELRVRGG
jgi:hypothetical protein